MLQYNDLNEDEKRVLREKLNISRVSTYFLEDNNYLIMKASELFEYIYLDDIKKLKDAISLINRIKETEIKQEDINKTMQQILLESNNKVIKISDRAYVYKES